MANSSSLRSARTRKLKFEINVVPYIDVMLVLVVILMVAARLQKLNAAEPDLPLLIAADKDVKYDEVVKTLASAKKLGSTRVGLATK